MSSSNCPCSQKMTGGSLASDMVMANVNTAADTPYDFLQSAQCDDVKAFKGVNQTAGSMAKKMISHHKKMMKHKKSHSKMSKSRKHKKTTRNCKKSKNRLSMKKSKRSKMSKMRKMSKMSMDMMGGGSDWMTSQYSQGPINNSGDLSNYFSSSKPSARGKLINPPNLLSAGSGAVMDFVGVGSPL